MFTEEQQKFVDELVHKKAKYWYPRCKHKLMELSDLIHDMYLKVYCVFEVYPDKTFFDGLHLTAKSLDNFAKNIIEETTKRKRHNRGLYEKAYLEDYSSLEIDKGYIDKRSFLFEKEEFEKFLGQGLKKNLDNQIGSKKPVTETILNILNSTLIPSLIREGGSNWEFRDYKEKKLKMNIQKILKDKGLNKCRNYEIRSRTYRKLSSGIKLKKKELIADVCWYQSHEESNGFGDYSYR